VAKQTMLNDFYDNTGSIVKVTLKSLLMSP
jgi:hypothetical protein